MTSGFLQLESTLDLLSTPSALSWLKKLATSEQNNFFVKDFLWPFNGAMQQAFAAPFLISPHWMKFF
jgi:hypothetical protein